MVLWNTTTFIILLVWVISSSVGYVSSTFKQNINTFYKQTVLPTAVTSESVNLRSLLESHLILNIKEGPFIADTSNSYFGVAENVRFTTDIISGNTKEEYLELSKQWSNDMIKELTEPEYAINRVITTNPNTIAVQWNVTFIPDSLSNSNLVQISRFLRLNLQFFNVLDRERIRSSFSWGALLVFVERIIYKGIVLLPHAVIVGTTEMTFKDEIISTDNDVVCEKRFTLISSKEKLNLVRSIDQGILKNRKLANDLLEFLDARRPNSIFLTQWNDLLKTRINTRSVPGMGQFDIDGLDNEKQTVILSFGIQSLGIATIAVLLLGFSLFVSSSFILYQE